MHKNYKNPTPKLLNDDRAFQNRWQSDDEGLVADEAFCKHHRQCLELVVGHVLKSQNVGRPAVGDLLHRSMGVGNGALDHRLEMQDMDSVAQNELDLDKNLGDWELRIGNWWSESGLVLWSEWLHVLLQWFFGPFVSVVCSTENEKVVYEL
ncbi:hypothetical protein VNO78_23928 [Psophocarpus tetragonolobus]|uniref:Uncharacterized protein n=1 Tax=Psophocarpus tetragonolobus TaxID=3891 RepID=A0AAN9S5N5_PSOTE